MLPPLVNCWEEDIRLKYDPKTRTVMNTEGVDIRPVMWGNTWGVEYLDTPLGIANAATYMHKLVRSLISLGYERGKDVRAATYDFRRAPVHNPEFSPKFKELIEETYLMNQNKSVVLLCHSFGGTYCLHFLYQQTQEWKDQYIRSMVTLGVPFAGSTQSLIAQAVGETFGIFFLDAFRLRMIQRTFSSSAALVPNARVFNVSEPIIQSPDVNYTARDLKEFYQALNHTNGYDMWLDSLESNENIIDLHPGVEVHCWVSFGIDTPERIIFHKSEDFLTKKYEVKYGQGDGTTNLISAKQCQRWKHETKKVHYQEFEKVTHRDLATDDNVIEALKQLLSL